MYELNSVHRRLTLESGKIVCCLESSTFFILSLQHILQSNLVFSVVFCGLGFFGFYGTFFVLHMIQLVQSCVASGFLLLLNLVFIMPGVIERWELIQAQALSKELRMKQKLQQWQQFNSDLNNVWVWLGETEEELEKLHHLDLSTDIQTIELRIKKLKVSFISLFH